MNTNPYQPPGNYGPATGAGGRTPALLLAAIGAWLASAYWAVMTLLVLSIGNGSAQAGLQIILPCFLVGLYAFRGFQMFRGDLAAARRIIGLHFVGGAVAVFEMSKGTGNSIFVGLHAVKVLIHVFGGFTAWRASQGK